jgi:hypothetical protein
VNVLLEELPVIATWIIEFFYLGETKLIDLDGFAAEVGAVVLEKELKFLLS